MKPRLLIFLLAISTCFGSIAQSKKLDSLYKLLSVTTNTRSKVDISNYIASEIRSTNADSALALAEKALSLAIKEDYEFGEGTSYLCMALANGVKGRYELSHENALKAISIADKLKSDSLKGYALLVLTSYDYNKGNYDVSIENALAAIKLFEKEHDAVGILKSRVLMSQVYQLKDDLPRAEKILQENLLLLPKLKTSK